MELNRVTQYAILAMAQLKTDGAPIPSSALAKLGDMPERFLLQVMRKLVTGGLVKSTRGVNGGYVLAKPAKDITLRDICEAINGCTYAPDSTLLRAIPKAHKAVSRMMEFATGEFLSQLSKIRLSDMTPSPLVR